MLTTIIALVIAALSSGSNNLSMRQEADEFLKNMPAGLQDKQMHAIEMAIAGDTTALHSIRNSRNIPQQLPDGVEARYITPHLRLYAPTNATKPLPLLIYLHGGGWVFGSINSCARFCGELAATGKAIVLAVDYRLAPENPYPAGLDDSTNALELAFEKAEEWGSSPDLISIGGDSSGGNLAVAAAFRNADNPNGKNIKSLLLFYPVVYAYPDGSESWTKYGKGYGLNSDIMETFNKAYIADADKSDPSISIGLANPDQLAKLPKTLLVAAERDILCDQGREFVGMLKSVGVDIKRKELTGAVHLLITVDGQEKAFRNAVKLASEFLSED